MANKQLIRILVRTRQTAGQLLDRLAAQVPPGDTLAQSPVHSAHGVIRAGLWLAIILFGIGGLWASFAPLDSAAVATGQVVLDSNRKTIQHLEGGIVDEIMVHEGDRVKAGQPLVRLHETASKAKLESLKNQYFTARAAEARLIAERDNKESMNISGADLDAQDDKDKLEILANQNQIFLSHRASLQSQISIIGQKIKEYEQEINGLHVQEKAQANQIELLNKEVDTTKTLLAHGNATRPRLFELERQEEDLRGQRGKNIASIAQAEQSIAESQLQIANLKEQHMGDTVKELKDTQLQISDLGEQIHTSADVLDRVVITAPLSGFVTSLNIHTTGGVISPGEKLMEIVPNDDKLIIEAQVALQDIDVVRPGLIAHIRLTAYKTRHMPLVDGKVITVSADRITDSRTNNSYYLARIEADAKQLKDLQNVELYPGMPADVLIVTGSRTLLAYLFDPLSESIHKSFRED